MSAGARPSPRITRLETVMLRLPLERPIVGPFGRLDARPNLLVRVATDAGVEGLGEIWANFPPWGCQERIEIVRNVLTPLLVGDDRQALALQRRLEAAGLLAVAIRPPTVPEGTARLRLVLRRDLPAGSLELLLEALGRP